MIAWVPGPLTNPLNGSHGHWAKHARWAREWREKTCLVLLPHLRGGQASRLGLTTTPKLITFTALVGSEWDDDGLRAALKPVRDALKDMRVIDDDRPSAGHTFLYRQERAPREHRGVRIEVAVATATALEGITS